MRTVPAVVADDGTQSPTETPWPPADAIAVVCDGATYTVYQSGDTLPPAPQE